MVSSTSNDSPLDTLAETAGGDVVEAFSALGNETRLAIMVALWEAYDPHAESNAVTFSELRESIGYSDPGNFQYHLNQLTETFINHTADGYQLRDIGLKIVQTVIAGTTRKVSLDPTEIDIDCRLCGGSTGVMYDDGWLYHVCLECPGGFEHESRFPEGALFGEPLSPAALHNRSASELYAAGRFMLHQVLGMKVGGLCPICASEIDSSITVCDDHEPNETGVCSACGHSTQGRIRWVCPICKYRGSTSPLSVAGYHPATVAFLYDHGVYTGPSMNDFSVLKANDERLEEIEREQHVRSYDPLLIEVRYRADGDELLLVLNQDMEIEDARRTSS